MPAQKAQGGTRRGRTARFKGRRRGPETKALRRETAGFSVVGVGYGGGDAPTIGAREASRTGKGRQAIGSRRTKRGQRINGRVLTTLAYCVRSLANEPLFTTVGATRPTTARTMCGPTRVGRPKGRRTRTSGVPALSLSLSSLGRGYATP